MQTQSMQNFYEQIKVQADRIGEYYFHVDCQFYNYDQSGQPGISFHAYIHGLDSARDLSMYKVIDKIKEQVDTIIKKQVGTTNDVVIEIESKDVLKTVLPSEPPIYPQHPLDSSYFS